MKNLIIEIPDEIPKGRYTLGLVPIGEPTSPTLPPVTPPDPPPVVDPPVVEPPDRPIDPDLDIVPKITNDILLWEGDSIGSNTLLPFEYGNQAYLVSYSAAIRKNRLHSFNPKNLSTDYLLNLDIIKDDKEVRGMVTAIVAHGSELYGLFEMENRLFLIEASNPHVSLKPWKIIKEVVFQGAKDTHHELYFDYKIARWYINGRLRNRDWITNHPIKLDSRGIRILESNNSKITSTFGEVYNQNLDPTELQPDYLSAIIRWDLYGSRVLIIHDNDGNQLQFTAINVFHKNSARPPSTRPDRAETGTGELYPRWYVKGKLFQDSPVDLKFHERSWPLPECEPWNPEVGQIFILGFLPQGDKIHVFYSHRKDPHYLAFEDQPPTEIWVGELDRNELIDWYHSV